MLEWIDNSLPLGARGSRKFPADLAIQPEQLRSIEFMVKMAQSTAAHNFRPDHSGGALAPLRPINNGGHRRRNMLLIARPTWLDLAHKKINAAVLAAYGWSDLLTDEGISDEETLLARLLALNLARVAKQGEVQPALIDEDVDE